MQLKRDTDYALQIMVCIAENLKENKERDGVRASSILADTGIPRVIFYRICGYLEDHNLVNKVTGEEGDIWLYPGETFWNQSLFSIAEAVEGNMQIFIIFGRNSHLLQKYGAQFEEAQKKVSNSLSEITMGSIIA